MNEDAKMDYFRKLVRSTKNSPSNKYYVKHLEDAINKKLSKVSSTHINATVDGF